MGAASPGGMQAMHDQGDLPIPDIVHIDQPCWYGEGGDMMPEEFGLARARALGAEIDRVGAENVAAFIGEPVQGAGAVIIPPKTCWPEIQRICQERDILLIADEVICGFGRTGTWFGSRTFGIKPDIMIIAKGLSSGYQPIGGSIVSDKAAAVIDAHECNHGYTCSGHPVACAVALENLRIIEEEGIINHVRATAAPYLEKRWAGLGDHPPVGEARSVGLMGALELTPDKATRKSFPDTGRVGPRCREHCLANRLVMRHVRDTMIISPPLIVSKAEIDMLIERAGTALDATLCRTEAGWPGIIAPGGRSAAVCVPAGISARHGNRLRLVLLVAGILANRPRAHNRPDIRMPTCAFASRAGFRPRKSRCDQNIILSRNTCRTISLRRIRYFAISSSSDMACRRSIMSMRDCAFDRSTRKRAMAARPFATAAETFSPNLAEEEI